MEFVVAVVTTMEVVKSLFVSMGADPDSFTRMSFRERYTQFLNVGMVLLSALMIWKGLIVYTQCEAPIVVVLSGSMEPAFQRGDILFLSYDRSSPIEPGEIVVFNIQERAIPIVHRVLWLHQDATTNATRILTKGDNNRVDDRSLYAPGQLWLSPTDIVGRAKIIVPYLGMATIIMNDYPMVKYVVLGVLGLFVLFHKEQGAK